MLLNNLSIYHNILKNSRNDVVQRDDKRYEVERLYSTSPIIFDYSETYLPDGAYMVEETASSTSKGKSDDACKACTVQENNNSIKLTAADFVFK